MVLAQLVFFEVKVVSGIHPHLVSVFPTIEGISHVPSWGNQQEHE